MNENFTTLLNAIEEKLRSGQGKLARQDLTKLAQKKIPRHEAVHFAALSWRIDAPHLGLRALYPVVRPERQVVNPPTELEVVEYAACLIRVGATEEALALLEKIDTVAVPRALLFKAFALVGQWNYTAAIPFLKDYLKAKILNPYQTHVGMVNLAAAYTYERRHTEASPLLEQLIIETQRDKHFLLLGNSLHLSAVNLIFMNRLEDAEKMIVRAKDLLKESDAIDEFLVRKWEAILDFLRHAKSDKALERLHVVRKEAKERKHWETIRDCDRYEAIARHDKELLLHLHFGTPFPSFQSRLLSDFASPLALPTVYSLDLGTDLKGKAVDIDLLINAASQKHELKKGKLANRLLSILASDFYRPIRLAPLHFRLYPGEYFNPASSPARIHVAVLRLRDCFKKHRVPLTIIEEGGAYSLEATAPCRLLVPADVTSSEDAFVTCLRKKLGTATFTTMDAAAFLKSPRRTTLRNIQRAIESGEIEAFGDGASKKYRLK